MSKIKKFLLVTSCDWPAGIRASLWTDERTDRFLCRNSILDKHELVGRGHLYILCLFFENIVCSKEALKFFFAFMLENLKDFPTVNGMCFYSQ